MKSNIIFNIKIYNEYVIHRKILITELSMTI